MGFEERRGEFTGAARHRRRSIRLRGYDYAGDGAYFVTICAHQRLCLFGETSPDGVALNAWGQIVQECWEAIPAHFPNVELDAFVVMPNHMHGIIVITDDASPARGSGGDGNVGTGRDGGDDVISGNAAGGDNVISGNAVDGDDVISGNAARGDGVISGNAARGDNVISGRGMTCHAPTIAPTIAPTADHALASIVGDAPKREFSRPIARSLATIIGSFKSAVTRRIRQTADAPDHPVWQRNYYEHIIRNHDALTHIRHYIINNPARWADDQMHPKEK